MLFRSGFVGRQIVGRGSGGPPGVSLDLGFMTPGTLDPRITFTRASIGTYFDVAGVLQTSAYNLIRNNTQAGAVAGTPGTLPTFWSIFLADGLTTSVVAASADYIDIRVSGIPTGTAYNIQIDNAVIVSGLPYTLSGSTAVVGGSLTNITSLRLLAGGSGGVNAAWNTTSTATRVSTTWTSAGASVQPQIAFTTVISSPVDITLRTGLVQLEQAAVMSAVATPTSGVANGAPRWDYDPVTHALRGLLIEEQRANIVFPSAYGAGWSIAGTGTLTGSAGTVPDGTNSAVRVTADVTNGFHGIQFLQTPARVGSTTYTGTLFAKAGTSSKVSFSFRVGADWGGAVPLANFDLAAGTTTGVSGGATATIQNVGNGWYRLGITATTSATTGSGQTLWGAVQNAGALDSYAGAGESMLFWGAQVEIGAFATSYIPTTVAAVTRSADVATMPTAAWLNAATGSLAGEFMVPYSPLPSGNPVVAELDDGTIANIIALRLNIPAQTLATILIANAPQGALAINGGMLSNTLSKVGMTYTATAMSLSANGSAVQATAVAALPTINRLAIGFGRATQLGGWTQRIRYWPRALTNSELQQVTT